MLQKISDFFSYASFRGLNSTNNKLFVEWRQKQMYKQIAFISSVTGILYIFLSFINRFTAPEASAFYIANIQLFVIPPYIFLVSYLAYKRKKYFYIELSLFIAPIYAVIFHILILSKFENFNTYQVELYLMIFWIFTISGLRLLHATIVSLIVFSIGALSAFLLYPGEPTEFIMHLSWMFVSLIFGFSGGYLFEESQRSTFFKQKELEELAHKDKLTGLYNRQKLEVMIEKELFKATRYQHAFGVIIFDIDFFKSVNDSYGHQVGDTVLINISDEISKNIRPTDTLFRWGGEEFIIVVLDVNRESLKTMAESLRQKIESMQHEKLEQLTISLGVTLSLQNDSVESLIRRADEALYNAKNSGRNRVEFL